MQSRSQDSIVASVSSAVLQASPPSSLSRKRPHLQQSQKTTRNRGHCRPPTTISLQEITLHTPAIQVLVCCLVRNHDDHVCLNPGLRLRLQPSVNFGQAYRDIAPQVFGRKVCKAFLRSAVSTLSKCPPSAAALTPVNVPWSHAITSRPCVR